MENQMEKNMANEMEAGIVEGVIGISITQIINGHGFLMSNYTRDYTKLQEGPLCPRLRGH